MRIRNALARIETLLIAQGKTLMALSQDLLDLTSKIDTATNGVAARLTALQSQVSNSMSDEEVANVKAALQAESEKLAALGANPADPVPAAVAAASSSSSSTVAPTLDAVPSTTQSDDPGSVKS